MTDLPAVQQPREAGLSYKSIGIAAVGGGGMLLPQTFGDVVAFSEIMSRSQHAIPKHLRGNPGACMAVTMQALRWEMDPFACAAKSYSVSDMIAYEAQLIAAVVHTRAPIARRPDYDFLGEGDDLRCRVSCEMLDGSTKVYESPRVGDIKTKNSPLWKSDVQQQLGYFSIRSWARRYTPEVLLGVYSPDELDEPRGPDRARDVTPSSMAERLAASRAQQGGFSSARVEHEIAGAVTTQQPKEEQDQDSAVSAEETQGRLDDLGSVQDGREMSTDGQVNADQSSVTAGETAPSSNLSDASPGSDGRTESGEDAPPSTSLSVDDRRFLGEYAKALRTGNAPRDLAALREKFAKDNPGRGFPEGHVGRAIGQSIYAIETKRAVGELSIEDADARIEGLLS